MARSVKKIKWVIGQLYKIYWWDHNRVSQTWVTIDELPEDHKVGFCTVGWVIREDDLYITVASTKEEPAPATQVTYGDVNRLLKGDVVKAEKI